MQKIWPFLVVGVAAFFAVWYVASRQAASKNTGAAVSTDQGSGWNFDDIYGGAAEAANGDIPAADTFGRLLPGSPFDNTNATQQVASFNQKLAEIANTFGIVLPGAVPLTGAQTNTHGGVVKEENGTVHFADGTTKTVEPSGPGSNTQFPDKSALADRIADKAAANVGSELADQFTEHSEAG